MRSMLAPVLLVLAACQTTPSAPTYVIECAPPATEASRCDLATFLRACQHASGHNYTWTEATDAELRSKTFDGPSRVEVPAEGFDAWLDATLARHGLALRPIGPPRLNVYSVAARG